MSSGAWQKQFSQHTPKWVAILFGVIFVVFGGFFLYGDLPQILTGKPTPIGWIGLAVLIVGPLIAWAIYFFRTNIDLICSPDGFTLIKETRKGKTEEMFLWSDVTATKYWETESHDKEKKTTTVTSWYEVMGPEGSLFQVTGSISGFDDLIQVFNDNAKDIPYRWEKQFGFQLSVGGIGMKRSRFTQAARPAPVPSQQTT